MSDLKEQIAEKDKKVLDIQKQELEFRNRVQAIVEAFVTMKKELDSERRAMENIWSRREKQIEKVVLNIAGMHGDLEGIAGGSLPAIKMLELPDFRLTDGSSIIRLWCGF